MTGSAPPSGADLAGGDLLTRVEGDTGFLTLARPRAIHALTQAMCLAMTATLLAWRGDEAVTAVIIEHEEGTRGFCAGGDVALLRRSALEDGGAAARAFFRDEYRLNHLLFTYPKPVIAFMDGITMGGGAGIALPADWRVATENTRLAMPETGIGLHPDVGGGWYLSRLPGHIGRFMALTGARLDGPECLWAGLATHYIPAGALPSAKQRIAAGQTIAVTLDDLSITPPAPRLAGNADRIERHFGFDRLEDVLASLAGDDGEWAAKELATLRAKSPQACKVALRELALSPTLPHFAAEMAMEYRLAARALARPDFPEGVRALLVDKTGDPRWDPATPEGVDDALVDAMFAPLPAGEEWTPVDAAVALGQG